MAFSSPVALWISLEIPSCRFRIINILRTWIGQHVLVSTVGFCRLLRIISIIIIFSSSSSLSLGMLSVYAQSGGLHWYFGRFRMNYRFLRTGLVREVSLYYTGPQRNFDGAK